MASVLPIIIIIVKTLKINLNYSTYHYITIIVCQGNAVELHLSQDSNHEELNYYNYCYIYIINL